MWIRLESSELLQILQSLPEGALSEKLKAPADPDADAFLRAVETDDDLEVDADAVVSRGEDGAFVMSWSWVSNEKAGLTRSMSEAALHETESQIQSVL